MRLGRKVAGLSGSCFSAEIGFKTAGLPVNGSSAFFVKKRLGDGNAPYPRAFKIQKVRLFALYLQIERIYPSIPATSRKNDEIFK